MKLSDYIKTVPQGYKLKTIREIAEKLGISEIYFRHMCMGKVNIPERYAVPIEKATNGLVTRKDIAPHMYE